MTETNKAESLRVSDPIHLELVKNALSTVAEEMGLTVVRSAYSSQVKEGGDSTAAIFDHRGRLLAQSVGSPLSHLASLRPSLAEVLIDFPADTMRDGDVFACNDPYRGGIHSNDVMIFRPVFVVGELAFFTASLMHVADIGGVAAGGLPANATEMYHEGLILPPLLLHREGVPQRAVFDIIAANSRTPDKVLGDIRAMIAGDNLGAERLVTLAERYRLERLRHLVDELLAYTDRRTRLDIAALPDGSHEGSFVIDDDGVEAGKSHTVRVKVTIDGDRIIADFTGTDPQAKGPINAAVSQSMSGVLFAIRSLLSSDIPVNDGSFGAMEVIFPRGSLCNPNPPAACNSRMATVMAIIEAMLRAVSNIVPHAKVATSSNVHVAIMSGVENDSRRVWAYIDPQFGGSGARADRDGMDVIGPLILATGGALHCIEAYEMEYPVRFDRFELWKDSGGPGRWRGGQGARREMRILTDGVFTGRATDRCLIPPAGAFGGQSGRGGGWVLNEGTDRERVLPPKITSVDLKAGDVVTMLTSAGGGFGPPEEREPERVLADVIDGFVTVESARDIYCVTIDPDTMTVDAAATAELRGGAR
ncbi:MAG: hydantoinase B/oxoprolinase family protein [Acidimicrobiales bacterium]